MTDSLEEIFKRQKEFADQIQATGRFPIDKNAQIDKLAQAIIQEGTELQRLTNWKWWKQPTSLNESDAKEELIDVFHFVIHAAIELGMNHESFYYEYMKKLQVNKQRQEQGY